MAGGDTRVRGDGHAGQTSRLLPGVEVQPRQRRDDTEQHSIFLLTDWREQKVVKLGTEVRS
jgi:hypothetical protein